MTRLDEVFLFIKLESSSILRINEILTNVVFRGDVFSGVAFIHKSDILNSQSIIIHVCKMKNKPTLEIHVFIF